MISLLLLAAAQGWTVYASDDVREPKNHVEFYDRCVGAEIVKQSFDTEFPAERVLALAQGVCRPKAQEFRPQLKRRSAEKRMADIDAKYAKTVSVFVQSLRIVDEPSTPEKVEMPNAKN